MLKLKNNGRRNSKLTEAQLCNGIDDDNRHPREDNKKQQRNEEIGLSQKYYQHQFDLELVQDGDRSALFSSFCERFIDN